MHDEGLLGLEGTGCGLNESRYMNNRFSALNNR